VIKNLQNNQKTKKTSNENIPPKKIVNYPTKHCQKNSKKYLIKITKKYLKTKMNCNPKP